MIVLIILCCIIYFFFFHSNHKKVQASNGKYYYVLKGFEKDEKEAAEILAKQEILVEKLIAALPPDKQYTKLIKKNWNPSRIQEATPYNQLGLTSYIENKRNANLCLRDKRTGELHADHNLMNLVLIHELSHCGTKSYGHNPEFKQVLTEVMAIAEGMNLVRNEDFSGSNSKCFCGMLIDGKVI